MHRCVAAGLVEPLKRGYQPYLALGACAIPAPEGSGISDCLWDLIIFGRGGRRGIPQKVSFIQSCLDSGSLSNEFPFILQDNFSESHPNTRVRESLLETFKASNQSQSAPSRPEKVEPSSVVRPSQAASGSKRDFQGESSSSSRPVAKAKGPTPIQVSLRYTPRFPRSQHLYRFSEANGPEEKHTLAFNEIEDKSKVRVLILDWHQVVDRGREGTTYSLDRVPSSNLKFISQCIEAADKFGKQFFVGILSYIDTDKRAASTLGYIQNTEQFAQVFHWGIIVRKDRCGAEGKCACVTDIIEQTGLYESSFFFIDDSSDVLSEFSDYLPQVRAAHIKLSKKPAAVDTFPRAKFLEDCLPYVEEWLSE